MNDVEDRPVTPALPAEPRWPAVAAMAALSILYAALPPSLSVISRWFLVIVAPLLVIPAIVAHRRGSANVHRVLTITINVVVTVALVGSVVLLIGELPEHRITPVLLLRSAAALWVSNILVFALWYWKLDAGGPSARDERLGHPDGAFLFPQMAMNISARPIPGHVEWSPNFVDYLFLAFNTSTALSPTDTQPLSHWAKMLMIMQSVLSLVIIVLLAARGVNMM